MITHLTRTVAMLALLVVVLSGAGAAEFPAIVNTQKPGENPPPPEASLKMITVPDGFKVTLFAAEPDVEQPIAMTVDDRGRLWVVENFTYSGQGWDTNLRDRVVIFEDTNHDGHFDKRTVFWEGGQNVSAIATGFGGVFVLAAPNMLFIPDKNGDDVPDAEPTVLLDGFTIAGIGHNIVNGLTYGPDGWIYGRHGIQSTSFVGAPGSTQSQRTRLNCSIWRYHPTRRTFEVVCSGTTNPWGFDYDDYGEMWFTNNVIGHLWHIVPGAHYKRMYGEDFNPRTYELIDQTADHYHWDTGGKWGDSREGSPTADKLGGGHSHCGGMIYLGDNFPADYRGSMFMCNTHGKRVNVDALGYLPGKGFTASHRPDFFMANNTWFKGIDLKTAPDGGVYITDWSDSGECHDHDGIHRTSGRIYKVTYGTPSPAPSANLSKFSDDQLVDLQLHKNDYYVRAARRILQERAAAGADVSQVHKDLLRMFDGNPDVTRKLRAMWALYVTGGAKEAWLVGQLSHADERVRAWAVRLLVDNADVSGELAVRLADLAAKETSGIVRLYLASACQRISLEKRKPVLLALKPTSKTPVDPVLPVMVWYAAEPVINADPMFAVALAPDTFGPVTRYCARRLTEDVERNPEPLNALLRHGGISPDRYRAEVLSGMAEALSGWRKATPPAEWDRFFHRLSMETREQASDKIRDLSVVFGDGRALDALFALVKDADADGEARKAALKVLIDNRPPELLPLLKSLIKDRIVQGVVIRGLANYDDPETPKLILSNFARYTPQVQADAVTTLTARPQWATTLLYWVDKGQVPRTAISAFHARQIQGFNDDKLTALLTKVWGEVRTTPDDKKKLMAEFHARLSPENMKTADASRGRAVFSTICAACHTLYGQGGKIGPDLTGANRDSLDYLLENIIDPSAVVPADFRMTVVTLKDGRVVAGLIPAQTERTITVQTPTEKLTLDRSEIAGTQVLPMSMMPEGQLQTMTEEQVRDLFAYLMTKQQVEMPK